MAAKQASIVNKRKEETKLNISSTIKTQMNNCTSTDRLGHQGGTENFCNFAKVFFF